MKNLILLLSIVFSFSSCSQNEEIKTEDNSIYGTWKLTERIGIGSDGLSTWISVKESEAYTYSFLKDGTVINSLYNCIGNYELNQSETIINITYSCNNSQTQNSFNLTFEKNNLILSPNPNPCEEGCAGKFIKVRE